MSVTRIDLHGARVLVVEDDYYLASDVQEALEAAGAQVIGPFATLAHVRRALADQRPDCALVDLNLGQGISFELPRRLLDLCVPFAFITGYDRNAIADEFADIMRVEKPVEAHKAVEIAALLIARRS